MSVWSELTGQDAAIAVFRAAAEAAGAARGGPSGSQQMTHSWLITGPPGSGRSNLAYAFATALISGEPDGDEATRIQVEARSHPDLHVLATEGVIIKLDDVRDIVKRSHYSPSVGRHRVIIVEDADRMTEQTSNVLLKELEEPPERTVWILCAPSEADLIPTIRSRVRSVRLQVPSIADVAALLERRDGVDAELAERAAREAQSHIGMAHRLATNDEARARRAETLELALRVRSAATAVSTAARFLAIAGDDAKAITELRDAEEREHALHSLGIAPGQAVPPALRPQLKALEDDQKRRATRSLRDGIDRILVDLASLYRDILLIQLDADVPLVNREMLNELRRAAAAATPARTLATLDAIQTARTRIEGNVHPHSRSRRCSSPRSAPPNNEGPHERTAHDNAIHGRAARGAYAAAACPSVARARRSRGARRGGARGRGRDARGAQRMRADRSRQSRRSRRRPAKRSRPSSSRSTRRSRVELVRRRDDLRHREGAARLERPRRRRDRTRALRASGHGRQDRFAARQPRRARRFGLRLRADSLDFAVGEPLKQRFDVVGFDPRGVDRSTAVACYDAASHGRVPLRHRPGERGSDEWIEDRGAAKAAFGEACLEETGDLLAQVDTESAARDLDLLRAVLGDDELNYLGYSYGTFLGATYAELYPEKVGRIVLDGAVDPTASSFDVNKAQAVGFEGALVAYLEDCLAGDDCPFSGTVDESVDEIGRLLASVDASPLRGSDGRRVDGDTLFTAIIYPLYSPDSWPYLSEMLSATMFGDGDAALVFADGYYGRDADGTYHDNSTEAFRSINCLDYPVPIRRRGDARTGGRDHRRRTDVRPLHELRRPRLQPMAATRPRASPAESTPRVPRRSWSSAPRATRRRLRVVGRARRPARERRARDLRGRGSHGVQQVERVRERGRRELPHRRHGALGRPEVLTWSSRHDFFANIDSRASWCAPRAAVTPP